MCYRHNLTGPRATWAEGDHRDICELAPVRAY
jgi:hypothetical protein